MLKNKKKLITALVIIIAIIIVVAWQYNSRVDVVDTSGSFGLSEEELTAKLVAETPDDVVKVMSPEVNTNITESLLVKGLAYTIDDVVAVFIQDSEGTILFKEDVVVEGKEEGKFGTFSKTIDYFYNAPRSRNLILEVSGRPSIAATTYKLSMPLIMEVTDDQSFQIFFAKAEENNENSCGIVVPIERTSLGVDGLEERAINMFLAGPADREIDQGIFSYLTSGAELNSFAIENGIARVDFNKSIKEAVFDDCRTNNLKQQIVKTLEQFSTVTQVMVSINGDNIE